jgi:hypothetical protein
MYMKASFDIDYDDNDDDIDIDDDDNEMFTSINHIERSHNHSAYVSIQISQKCTSIIKYQ